MYNKKKGKYEELIAENDKKWEQYAEDTLECAGILYKSIEQHINNKDISKKLMLTAGVKTADWKTYNLNSLELHNELNITYPAVLKPLNCGSSIGVTILENIQDLQDAINAAKAYESDVLI